MLLHDPDDFVGGWTAACRGEKEVEAESTAFLTAAHVGLDTSDYTFGYVTGWAEKAISTTGKAPHEIVQATGRRVVGAAATLTTLLDEALGLGEAPVPEPLRSKVVAGSDAAATVRAQAEAALVDAGQAQPGLFDTPPAAGRAFPPPQARTRPTMPAPAATPSSNPPTAPSVGRPRR